MGICVLIFLLKLTTQTLNLKNTARRLISLGFFMLKQKHTNRKNYNGSLQY